MKFEFHIYKTGNLFHFVSNLTEWHFSCSKTSKEAWLKKTGPLSKTEKNALNKFKKIILKYGFNRYLGIPFIGYSDRTAQKSIERWVLPTELKIIKKTFTIFQGRFEKIWKKEYQNLINWKKILERSKISQKGIIDNLENFFGKSSLKETKIYLLISGAPNHMEGGSNIGYGKITLGPGLNPKSMLNDVICLIWHEAIHLLCGKTLLKEIRKYLRKNNIEKELLNIGLGGKIESLLEEGIVSSLTPEGYLAKKYFNCSLKVKNLKSRLSEGEGKENFYLVSAYVAQKTNKTTKDYIENKKPIDENYIKKIHQSYLDYLKIKNS